MTGANRGKTRREVLRSGALLGGALVMGVPAASGAVGANPADRQTTYSERDLAGINLPNECAGTTVHLTQGTQKQTIDSVFTENGYKVTVRFVWENVRGEDENGTRYVGNNRVMTNTHRNWVADVGESYVLVQRTHLISQGRVSNVFHYQQYKYTLAPGGGVVIDEGESTTECRGPPN